MSRRVERLVPVDKPLNPRQQRFVEEYVVHLNGYQAAITAGYSPKTALVQASTNLIKPNVKAAIQAALQERAKNVSVTAEMVVQKLWETVEKASQARPVLKSNGKPSGQFTFQGKVVVQALELLGRHLGMFNDRLTVTTDALPAVPVDGELVLASLPLWVRRTLLDAFRDAQSRGIEQPLLSDLGLPPSWITEIAYALRTGQWRNRIPEPDTLPKLTPPPAPKLIETLP